MIHTVFMRAPARRSQDNQGLGSYVASGMTQEDGARACGPTALWMVLQNDGVFPVSGPALFRTADGGGYYDPETHWMYQGLAGLARSYGRDATVMNIVSDPSRIVALLKSGNMIIADVEHRFGHRFGFERRGGHDIVIHGATYFPNGDLENVLIVDPSDSGERSRAISAAVFKASWEGSVLAIKQVKVTPVELSGRATTLGADRWNPDRSPGNVAWQDSPVYEDSTPLVPIGPLSEYGDIHTAPVPLGTGSRTLFVRRPVADALRAAQYLLPPDMRLIVFDAYREPASSPVGRATAPDPPPQQTGGSIAVAMVRLEPGELHELEIIERYIEEDVARCRPWGRPAERIATLTRQPGFLMHERQRAAIMGRAIVPALGVDADTQQLAFYEALSRQQDLTSTERIARNNRRLLDDALRRVGLQPSPDSWLQRHFYDEAARAGTQRGAATVAAARPRSDRTTLASTWGPTSLSPDNRAFAAWQHHMRSQTPSVRARASGRAVRSGLST